MALSEIPMRLNQDSVDRRPCVAAQLALMSRRAAVTDNGAFGVRNPLSGLRKSLNCQIEN